MSSQSYDRGRELPPTTFHRFSQLPFELRVMVWDLCFPSTRIIEITYPPFPLPYLRSRTPPPVLLHVNQESRAMALSRYSLLKLNPVGSLGAEEYIPIDYRVDTLFINLFVDHYPQDLDGWMGALEDNPEERDKIRRLAFRFHRNFGEVGWPENYMCYWWLRDFSLLDLWIVVLGDDDGSKGGTVKLLDADKGMARSVVRCIRKEGVEQARASFFGSGWVAPKVKACKIIRVGVKKARVGLSSRCWKHITGTYRGGSCMCTEARAS
jgi:hypothetical protein